MQMDPVVLVGTLLLLSLAPFAVMMTTSYVKIVVVLSLVRNALGVQQVCFYASFSCLVIY